MGLELIGRLDHEVDLDGVTDETRDDTKRVGKKIKIGAKLSIANICKLHFNYVSEKCEKQNSATGDWSANSATGYGSANVSTGTDCSNTGGKATLNAAWGKDNKCRGDVGAYLVLSEWGEWDGEKYPLLGAVMVVVDGEKIKANTWYTLKNGAVFEIADYEQ